MLYTAQFSKIGAPKVACGGVYKNEFKVFDKADGYKQLHSQATAGVYTMDFSPASHHLAVAGAGDTVGIVDLQSGEYNAFVAVGYRDIAIA